MIPGDVIKNAIKLVAGYAGITFVRAEQNGQRPGLPFMEYKVTGKPEDPMHTADRSLENKLDDATKVTVTTERGTRALVSLTFFGKDMNDTWSFAELARDYLESDRGKNAIKDLGVFPRIMSDPNDRTTYLETEYESRVGFDIALDGSKVQSEDVDAIDLDSSVAALQL